MNTNNRAIGWRKVWCLLQPLIGVLFTFWLIPVQGQGLTNTVAVNDDRPLYHAVNQVAEQTKTFITFEEMTFEHPDDLIQAPPWRGQVHFVARYGEFDFEYEAGTPVKEVLEAMLVKYHSEYPGTYKVIGERNAFHIVPGSSRDSSGNFVPRKSLLDSKVTLNVASGTGLDIVCEIVRQAAVENGVELGCSTGFGPSPLASATFKNYNATGVVARDLLVDILTKSGNDLSWVLLRSLNTNSSYISFLRQSR
jgi:hypothetical protein